MPSVDFSLRKQPVSDLGMVPYVFADAAVNGVRPLVVFPGTVTMKFSKIATGRLLAVLALVLCCGFPASAQGFKWWQDEGYKRELGLTQEQRTRLEEVFQKSLPGLRKQKELLDRALAEFDRLVERGDDATVMGQVTIVEAARTDLNKERIMMLLRMRRSLTADQWAKFSALHEQGRDRGPGPKRQ